VPEFRCDIPLFSFQAPMRRNRHPVHESPDTANERRVLSQGRTRVWSFLCRRICVTTQEWRVGVGVTRIVRAVRRTGVDETTRKVVSSTSSPIIHRCSLPSNVHRINYPASCVFMPILGFVPHVGTLITRDFSSDYSFAIVLGSAPPFLDGPIHKSSNSGGQHTE
jgi:hypothetical protein